MPGQIYFAWVDPSDVFDEGVHNVEDEQVFGLKISQSEGSFARAVVEVVNPGEGLLAPGRKTNVFISMQDGISVKLLFAGRLVGFPLDFRQDTIELDFIAQPEGWQATQFAFTEALKVAPYYNPLFISEENRSRDDEILAGYSALLHWHRATGDLVLSDIIEGSSLIDAGENTFFDGLSSTVGDPPVRQVDITVEVQWEQVGVGLADCSETIRNKFTNTAIATPQINTLTPISLEKGWEGVRIPTGYSVSETKLVPVANGFGLTASDLRSGNATVAGADYPTATGAMPALRLMSVPRVWYTGTLVLQAEYRQKRRELFAASLIVDTQEISLTTDQVETMDFRLQDPTATAQGEVLDIGVPSFFQDGAVLSTYGDEVVQHALMRARARLIKAARVVETTFEAPFDDFVDVTCDHSARIEDSRLPGGSIRGKVVGYELSIEGDSGKSLARVTIASCIGTGSDFAGSGTPIAEVTYDNEFGAATMDSGIYYEQTVPPTILEPIDVAQMEADDEYLVLDATVDNDGESQNTGFVFDDPPNFPDVYLQNNRTRIEVELRSMNPEPELFADVPIVTYNLTLPRQVNLEAV